MLGGSSEIWNSKKECRSYFKSLCAQEFEQGLVQNHHQKQLDNYLRDFMSTQSGCWGAYRALSQEASVDQVFQLSHIDWVFPRVVNQEEHLSRALDFCRTQDFTQGAYGILEPALDATLVEVESIQGILVPGLAFNRNGNRLGKGKGYYDRTLQIFEGLKVGICFQFQIAERDLPVEAHDIGMDFLITDAGIINCQGQDLKNRKK